MKEKLKEKIYSNKEFISIVSDIMENETVLEMKKYRQHFQTTCYEHCLTVAYYNYIICKKLNLDYVSASRAGMLHDLFLYDWRKPRPDGKGLHAFRHPRTALNNASKIFNLNNKEKDIILKHMWPLTVVFPKYKESFIITLTDKYAAIVDKF